MSEAEDTRRRDARRHADDALLAEIGEALRAAGPPSETMIAGARAAFAWRTVDEELAALSYDSRTDDLVAVRGAEDDAPTLVYEASTLAVELQLLDTVVLGQLVPAGPGEVVALAAEGEVARADTDALGCFRLPVVGTAPLRLRCTTPDSTLLTDWIAR